MIRASLMRRPHVTQRHWRPDHRRRSRREVCPPCNAIGTIYEHLRGETFVMFNLRKRYLALPLAGATLLGGCAAYPRPSSYSYFSVPCDTPGAVRAVPVVPTAALAGSPTDAPLPANSPEPADAASAPANAPAGAGVVECLVAVADRGRGPGAGYYPGGYGYRAGYPYGYYGSPFRGSLGIGVGIGGHRSRGGHFGGSHIGGGHGGGHHGGRH